jgi:hypothetical protein
MDAGGETELGISYEDRNGYLYVFFSGKREGLKDARRYWLAAIEECNRRGYKRLLVEQYFPVPLSRMDTFYLAEEIARMPIRNLRAAFVDRDVEQNGMNLFAETVAVNRGGVGKVFTNFVDAEAYLLASTSSGEV